MYEPLPLRHGPGPFADVGPHDFDPKPRTVVDRLLGLNRVPAICRACYLDEDEHPVTLWAEARPYGDTTVRRPRYAPYSRNGNAA